MIRFFADRGWAFLEGFGLTETSPTCTVMDAAALPDKAGSVGRALRHVDCRIVADDGTPPVPPDGTPPGELTVCGPPNVFAGYWRLPERRRRYSSTAGSTPATSPSATPRAT